MKILSHLFTIITVVFLTLCIGCSLHQSDNNYAIPHTKSIAPNHTMVVFVHGTVLPVPHLYAFGSSLHESLEHGRRLKKSWYQLYLDRLKNTSIYRYQPSGPDGLHPVKDQPSAKLAAEIYQGLACSSAYSFYSFGWNGQLSNEKRVQAANELYQQLNTEAAKLKKVHGTVNIIVICHSHGGNVALNLARAEQQFKQNLMIDKLVLLGTPIQSETAAYVSSTCFEKVYNFYSHGDCIQKIDIVSTEDDLSARTFQPAPNLIQVELTCGKLKPGHIELWLFKGKNNIFFRRALSLAPFPLAVFLPIILQELDTTFPHAPQVKLDIEKTALQRCFKFSHETQHSVYAIEEKLLKPYETRIAAL